MDVIDVLGDILADIEKQSEESKLQSQQKQQEKQQQQQEQEQNRPSKQSINPSNGINEKSTMNGITNHNNLTTSSQPQKSVRFTNDPSPNHNHSPIPMPPPMMDAPRSPTPSNKLLQPHHQPLKIEVDNVDNLQVPGDRTFLHSPSADILASNGARSPLIRTPSPGGTLNGSSNHIGGQKSPTIVLNRMANGGWVPSPRNADASEGVPVYSPTDENEDWNFQSYHLDYKYTPPPIKGPCHICNLGIMGAMVTALDKMWHPECFTCVNCHKELRSPGYVEHGGQPYCKHCYFTLFLPPCSGCNKEIKGNYVQPMGKGVYHPQCFTCSEPKCRKVLDPENFMQKSGKPYCEDCYHDLFSPKCDSCRKPIINQKPLAALGKIFHPKCFTCSAPNCRKVLSPDNFLQKSGKPYCETCYHDLFSPKCDSCKRPIVNQQPTNALGKTFHPNCFQCSDPRCRRVLSPDNFLEKGGKPYCESCYHDLFSPKCDSCRKPIVNQKPANALGKIFHPHCFTCTEPNCRKVLSPTNFMQKNGNPYCENCYHNLFSPKCDACKKPIINQKPIYAMGKTFHPEHFCCSVCGKQLNDNEYYEKDGLIYCEKDYLDRFAPKCRQCRVPITDDYCLFALDGDWHANCFRCLDCNCLLEDVNFFEINNQPFCEKCFHARQCPDCIKMRRAQNRYFRIPENTPMQVRKWASQVSLKSLELNQRPLSQISQYSYASSTYEAQLGGRTTPSQSARSSYIIPIEREGATSSSSNNQMYHHIYDQNGTCLHDHHHDNMIERSGSALSQQSQQSSSSEMQIQKTRESALGGKSAGWKKSQDNLQFIARNESPYVYNEPGKFPVLEPGRVRFEEVVTKKEYLAETKHY